MPLLALFRPLLWPSLAVLAAVFVLRYWMLEGGGFPSDCESADAPAFACSAKWLLVQSFQHQRLGWLSLALALAAFVFERRALAFTGWLTALAGLVLYNYDYAGVAAMMSLLILARTAPKKQGAVKTS